MSKRQLQIVFISCSHSVNRVFTLCSYSVHIRCVTLSLRIAWEFGTRPYKIMQKRWKNKGLSPAVLQDSNLIKPMENYDFRVPMSQKWFDLLTHSPHCYQIVDTQCYHEWKRHPQHKYAQVPLREQPWRRSRLQLNSGLNPQK